MAYRIEEFVPDIDN